MKQVVYYSDYMKEKQREKKTGKFKRICTYTLVAVLSMQGTQMYSMASFMELFQKYTNIKVNAFVPKKYTNVAIEEPNGQNYTIDENGNVHVRDSGQTKQAYFTNPIDNVTYEYVRARIVAVVKYVDGRDAESIEVTYKMNDNNTPGEGWEERDGYYYYKEPLQPGGQTTNLFDRIQITSPKKSDLETLDEHGKYIEFNVIVDTIETDENGDTAKADKAWGVSLGNILN